MKTDITTKSKLIHSILAAAAMSATAMAQQASLTLFSGASQAVQYNNTEWSLDNIPNIASIPSGVGSVLWDIVDAKLGITANSLVCNGFITIANTGSADATIGSIVVNLQRKQGKNWVTVSSDIANASQGDAATSALISPTASSEGKGSFSENAASGAMEFYNDEGNTVFSLSPQQTIAPDASIYLFWDAKFNNSLLNIPAGEFVRYEVIVTFGNSGGRGGSGASSKNLDINGNGVLDADEANVRSVPYRVTLAVPACISANANVTVKNPLPLNVKGTVISANSASSVCDGACTHGCTKHNTYTEANGGSQGGQVINSATLQGQDLVFPLLAGYEGVLNPDGTTTFVETYHNFVAVQGVKLVKDSAVDVAPVGGGDLVVPIKAGDFTTYTIGGWGALPKPKGGNPGTVLHIGWATVFGSAGVTVGIGNSMKFTSAQAVTDYLPDGGTANKLTSNLVNPTKTSSGVFGSQVLAVKLALAFSNAGVKPSGLASLKIRGTGTYADGMSIAQFLSYAESVLGGTVTGVNIPELNEIATGLNEAFDNGDMVSAWAAAHLTR